MKTQKRTKKFDENSTIKEIISSEKGFEILMKHKVPCLGCPMASLEIGKLKIKDVANLYGIDLNKLLKDLNSYS